MTPNTLFRWEQNGAGKDDGTATFFPDTPNETALRIDTFKEAIALYRAIESTLKQTRWDARAGLLAEIARIKP